MAPPQWAYQVENFDPPPDEELLCSICRCVFCEPVECPCHHVFCKACIVKWLNIHKNCPVCRKRTYRTSLHAVVPIIRNMIMKLHLKCKNTEHGCDHVMTLESVENHLKNCEYEYVECSNGCTEPVLRKNLTKHESEECVFRDVKCKTCGLHISESSEEHNCVKELKKIIEDQEKIISEKTKEIKKLQEQVSELKASQEQRQPSIFSSPSSSSSSDDISSLLESSIWSSAYTPTSSDDSAVARLRESGSDLNFHYSDDQSDREDENRDAASELNGNNIIQISNAANLFDDESTNEDFFSGRSHFNDVVSESPSVLEITEEPNFNESTNVNTTHNESCIEISSVNANNTVEISDGSVLTNTSVYEEHSPENTTRRSLKRRLSDSHNKFIVDEENCDFTVSAHMASSSSNHSSSSELHPSPRSRRRQQEKDEKCSEINTLLPSDEDENLQATAVSGSLASFSADGPSTSSAVASKPTVNSRRKCQKFRDQKNFRSKNKKLLDVHKNSSKSLSASDHNSRDSEEGSQNTKVRRIFERTLSLLEQHNLDSDPDWVPGSNDGGISDSSSSSSSSLLLDFESSQSSCGSWESGSNYKVKIPVPTYDLLEKKHFSRYCAEDSDDDPDWMPEPE